MKLGTRTIIALLTLVVIVAGDVHGGGYAIRHQTAKALGLASATIAGINDPSAVYYNPAALSEVEGNQILINGSYINVLSSMENSGRKAVDKHDDNLLAALFINYHIPSTDLTLGFGSYAPFGLATTYERDFTRFAALRSEIRTLYVTPALSWHPSRFLSVGAGLSFVHSSALLSRSLCFDFIGGCVTPGGPLEGRIRVTDTANAFTYNLGVLIKPNDRLKLGFSYRARADLRFDKANVKFGGPFTPTTVKADVRPVPLPPVINIGLFWQINPSWGAEFVYEYTRWSEFKRVSAFFSPVPTFFGAPISSFSLPQNWKNTSTLRLGSFYRLNENFEIRGGMAVDETPIPNRTLTPAIPGADLLTLNAGIGYKMEKFTIDLGYMAVFYKNRKISNLELEGIPATRIPFLGAPGKDKYETFNHFVSITLGYRF